MHVSLPDDPEAATKTFAEFLNQHQDLILIGMQDGETVYQGRNFYLIDYAYAERALISLIESPNTPGRYQTEKGSKAQIKVAKATHAAVFPDHSLFRAVVDGAVPLPFTVDLLICADLGTECADFVAANFASHELALIHAKAGSGQGISASAFHEVVAQAMKNLVYLAPTAEIPDGVGSWTSAGRWNSTGIPRLLRVAPGLPSRAALWRKIKAEILESSNPRLYVVLLTTGCCRMIELEDAVKDSTKRTPETAQLLHLLDGLNSHARQLGVQLRVYDLPYDAPPKKPPAKKAAKKK